MSTILLLAMTAFVGGCGIVSAPDVDRRPCHEVTLEAGAQAAGIFPVAGTSCVIVAWDSNLEDLRGPAGEGSHTPESLLASAAEGGFTGVCESSVWVAMASPTRTWLGEKFPGLDPTATEWGVALFVADPHDGIDPRCDRLAPS